MKVVWKGEPSVVVIPGYGEFTKDVPKDVPKDVGERMVTTKFFEKASSAKAKPDEKASVETEGGNE